MNILHEYKDVIIEIFKTTPAWIALIISIISPILNKKLEIENKKVTFLFSKRLDIFENHFRKLYEFRNIVINLVAVLLYHYEHHEYTNVDDINAVEEQLQKAWNEIRLNEASLWLIADSELLKLKEPILDSVKGFFQKRSSLSQNGILRLNKQDLEELIYLAKSLQNSIGKILETYREMFSINKK